VVRPRISVVVPTFNRAELLEGSLESMLHQTLRPAEFEVIVVDDGSTDETAAVCQLFESRLQLRHVRIANSGISAAKNLGLFLSEAPLTLFFDDDDLADPALLRAHLDVHALHPDANVAVLGYTTWDPRLEITPVMEYVTEIGQLLFSYPNLADGQLLDFRNFWGGRSSCKRAFLAQHGVFNQDFPAIIEDIELGYRLSKHGLRVIFSGQARSYMNRPVTYEQFCSRCERQGKAHRLFSQLHPDREVLDYCRVDDALERWKEAREALPAQVERVATLERDLDSSVTSTRETAEILAELRGLYGATFEAFRLKGALGAGDEEEVVERDAIAGARARH
jgi:glycosyltransferase involved in cell wall biosynthesis